MTNFNSSWEAVRTYIANIQRRCHDVIQDERRRHEIERQRLENELNDTRRELRALQESLWLAQIVACSNVSDRL